MDEAPAAWKERLALAHLCHSEQESILRVLFAADSTFWSYRQQYVHEWAAAVVHEDKHDFFMTDIMRVAQKASPLKLASTGLLLLADLPELIAEVDELVDQSLVLLQMADDLADWEDDLQEGNYNCLLSLIRAERPSTPFPLSSQEVESHIYDRGLMNVYCARGKDILDILNNSPFRIEPLYFFGHSIYQGIASFTKQVEHTRRTLLSGGFDYILSNHQIK